MKNHSCNLHAPLCGIFHPNSVVVARAQKNTVPAAIALSAKTVLSVRLQGFEPWTP
ncbi:MULTISPECIES: DUF6783 domain-containing protein [Blautia]|uniref:DUF6783 domain-containing protein n=1 Tax=Blautia acetigignens TaxID=2981783 RepID=A0ABV1CR11_9FIRM